jgi:two-component system nitrogen regulation sensor histidine kinase NtrY
VGLDIEGRVTLPNRSASTLLGVDLDAAIGLSFARIAPEFAELLEAAAANPERPRVAEILIGPATARRTLLARIGAEAGHRHAARLERMQNPPGGFGDELECHRFHHFRA